MTTDAAYGRLSLAVTLLGVGLLFAPATSADDSFAQQVPADVGLFVELSHADDLLIPLTETQAWLTVAELAGQPADTAEADQWRRRVEQTIGMGPIEAVRVLFADRVGFVSEGFRSGPEAVVLCRPVREMGQLIRGWPARPLPTAGRYSAYRLPNNVGMGVHGRTMVFGDLTNHTTFTKVLDLIDAEQPLTLADDPTYQRLLARVPPRPMGLFFARLGGPTSAPATSPAPGGSAGEPPGSLAELPALLRGSAHVLLALHRQGHLLQLTAVGDAPATTTARDGSLGALVSTLPKHTLLAWASHVDYTRFTPTIMALPEQHALRVAYQNHARAGTIARLGATLNSAVCIAVGVVQPDRGQLDAPPVPAVAVLVSLRDPARAAAEWEATLRASVSLYALLSLQRGGSPSAISEVQLDVAGRRVHQFDLSALLGSQPEQTPLGALHLSWTRDDDVLIVASHTDWLRQILAARHQDAQRLADVLEATRQPPKGPRDTIFVAQTGPIADLGTLWLQYFARAMPRILNENWWRNYQPGGQDLRLGVQVRQDGEQQRLIVSSTTPGMPAHGILKPGDEIYGCNRLRFATSRPVYEIARGIRRRPNARWVDLWIERDRIRSTRRVPLPFVDPIQVLRRVVAVGNIVQCVVYHDDMQDAEGPRGYLTVELRTDSQPPPAPQPAPVSQPVASPPDVPG